MEVKTAAQWEAVLVLLREKQEKQPTFETWMSIDHATKMAAGARLRERKLQS